MKRSSKKGSRSASRQKPESGPRAHQQEPYTPDWTTQEEEPLFRGAGYPGRRRSRGAQVALSLICGLFTLSVLALAGYGVFSLAVGARDPEPQSSHTSVGPSVSLREEHSDSSAAEAPVSASSVSSEEPDYPSHNVESEAYSGPDLTGEPIQGGMVSPPTIQPPVVTGPLLELEAHKRPQTLSTFFPQEEDGPLSVEKLAQKVRRSVVGILTYQQGRTTPVGQGSGMVLTDDGYIVTNAHVVENAEGIHVVLSNSEEYEGILIGVDNRTDLAVIKIDAHNLYPVTIGDSEQLQVGETVVAVGNAGGLDLAGSVTAGIVSTVDRPVRTVFSSGYIVNCIQTDAAINPGNTGGPLVDCYGRVMGLNSSHLAHAEYEGVNFALPINDVIPAVQDLVRYGRVTGRVWLGISAVVLNEVQAKLNDLPVGLLLSTIYADSTLSQAGVQPGDVLVRIDDHRVEDMDGLRDMLEDKSPGDLAVLQVYRPNGAGGGDLMEFIVYLIEDNDHALGSIG